MVKAKGSPDAGVIPTSPFKVGVRRLGGGIFVGFTMEMNGIFSGVNDFFSCKVNVCYGKLT